MTLNTPPPTPVHIIQLNIPTEIDQRLAVRHFAELITTQHCTIHIAGGDIYLQNKPSWTLQSAPVHKQGDSSLPVAATCGKSLKWMQLPSLHGFTTNPEFIVGGINGAE